MKPQLLILSTYSFEEPRHGGQIRLSNLRKAYLQAGWDIEVLVIGDMGASAEKTPNNVNTIALNYKSPFAQWGGKFIPWISDFLAGQYAFQDPEAWNSIFLKLPKKIDVISVEHPWLWSLAKRIQALPQFQHIKLIYSSQNVETTMKAQFLASLHIPHLHKLIYEIELIEKDAVQQADLVTVVSQSDFDFFSGWGAKRILLAENGVSPWTSSANKIDEWSRRLPKGKWPLYVSSAHPPNFLGFAQALGWNLGAIPPDSQLVLAGGAAAFIKEQFIPSRADNEAASKVANQVRFPELNESRIKFLGVLSEPDLNAVKSLASTFVLPIASGGGTNIKTAEALVSRTFVIGTPLAFRGYEQFMELPTVRIASTPEHFSNTLQKILSPDQSTPKLSENQCSALDGLNWERRLVSIPKYAQSLLN